MNRFTASASGWSRRAVAASAVGALAAAVTLVGAPEAVAANGYLEFSLDGKTYSPSISGPIFKETFLYVPGATLGATLWIRNSSSEPARLSSAAVMVRSDPQLDRQIGLAAGHKTDLSARSVLGSQGSCTDVSGVWDLESGEDLELSLVVDLSTDAPNDTMNRAADFDVVFLLESKDAAPRQACDALAGPLRSIQPGAVAVIPGPPETATESSQLATLAGISGARPVAGSNSIFPAALPERQADARSPQTVPPVEQLPPAAIVPAGFQSTVEPIIRSLSGTLLIGMSVLFAAAAVLRIRNRSANE